MSGRRVGFYLSDKKRRRMDLVAFAELCAGHGVEVVEIDLSQPLVSQGPFDVIVHKLSDVIVEAEHDSQSQQLLTNFQSYVSAHPSVVLLDPLAAMTELLDRFTSYRIMGKLQHSLREWCVCSPPYLEICSSSQVTDIQQAVKIQGLSFPLICKTRVAHGSRSHQMCLIFSVEGLRDAHPPCVLQSFVNHGAVLHKVFVVGDAHFTVERPSLKNFSPGPCDRKTIFFNSHEVSKPESCSDLTALDEQVPLLPPPSAEAMAALVGELRTRLGMALFGVDIILDIHTHTLTVIDINIFPGYEGVPEFFSSLLSHIESVLDSRTASQAEEPQNLHPQPDASQAEEPQDHPQPASQAEPQDRPQPDASQAEEPQDRPQPDASQAEEPQDRPQPDASQAEEPQDRPQPASQATDQTASQAAPHTSPMPTCTPASQADPLDLHPQPASQADPLDLHPQPASQADPLDLHPQPASQADPLDLHPQPASQADPLDLHPQPASQAAGPSSPTARQETCSSAHSNPQMTL